MGAKTIPGTDRTIARRKRSELSRQDCLGAVERFAQHVCRFGTTSDASMFSVHNSSGDAPMTRDQINVQILVQGSFGVADEFFEALRVLAGFKLPRKTKCRN